MDTYVTMHGNLVGDPVRTVTAAGHRVTKIRLASNGRRMDPQTKEWVNTNTVFMTISCWRQLGDNVYTSLHKGDTVVVLARLNYREWEDDKGGRRSAHELEAVAVGPDLGRYVVMLSRPNRELPEAAVPAQSVPAEPGPEPERVGSAA